MGWVCDNYSFPMRAARLLLTRYEHVEKVKTDVLGGHMSAIDPPEKMAFKATQMIEGLRPDLKGGQLLAMRYDWQRACWEFVWVHSSLPECIEGEELPVVLLGECPEVFIASGS